MSAPIVEATGTLTADGTEQTLATIAAPRTLVCVIDLSNLADGDVINVGAYRKVVSGGPHQLLWTEYITGVVVDSVLLSAAMPSPHSGYFTLQQVAGTYRQFAWSIESL